MRIKRKLKSPLKPIRLFELFSFRLNNDEHKQLDQDLQDHLHKHTFHDLSVLVRALKKKNVRPSDETLEMIEKRAMATFDRKDTASQCDILYAFAVLAKRPSDDFIRKFASNYKASRQDFTSTDKAHTLLSLAIFDALPGTPIERLTRLNMKHEVSTHRYEKECEYKIINDVCLWFGIDCNVAQPPEHDNHSVYETMLSDAFNRAGHNTAHQQPANDIDEMEHAVDLMLAFHDAAIIVEFDGPHHYNTLLDGHHKEALNGKTLFQSALIKKMRPEQCLLRVGYADIGKHPTTDELDDYVAKLLDTLEYKASNDRAYTTRKAGNRVKLSPLSLNL